MSRTGSPRTFQRIADPAPATGGAGAAGAARRGGRASICPLVFSFSDRRGLRVTVPAWGTVTVHKGYGDINTSLVPDDDEFELALIKKSPYCTLGEPYSFSKLAG